MIPPRVAFVTIGQAPRGDVVPEMLALLGAGPDGLRGEEFGALDGVPDEEIAAHRPRMREARLTTRVVDGTQVVLGAGFVAQRLEPLLRRLDGAGFDLIVLISTSLFQPFRLNTPFIHAQQAVDAWIAALVMGDCALGLVHALPQQQRDFGHGTLVQNARTLSAAGQAAGLDEAARRLAGAHLILMHSMGYTEAEARRMAMLTRRPVVTARRIVAGAVGLWLAGRARPAAPAPPQSGPDLLDQLPEGIGSLTPRERDVLAAVLEGSGNKEIGRRLGISHRTVEIHRGRAMAKVNASSPTELIRRVMMARDG
ncbi:AroM family protein [Muricoccus vinaceus]|uniref:AroM family protein n=1 Tax=Muricoccus vinaceus TaxID=424704 RepID=A0ABV6IZH8_9PROT